MIKLINVLHDLKLPRAKPKEIQGVHCDMLQRKCIFWAEKIISQAENFFLLKKWKINIYEYLKTFHER